MEFIARIWHYWGMSPDLSCAVSYPASDAKSTKAERTCISKGIHNLCFMRMFYISVAIFLVSCFSFAFYPLDWLFIICSSFCQKASICHRKAILSFLAGLDVNELPLFFALLIKPLQIVKKTDGPANLFWTLPGGSICEFQASSLLEYFTLDNIATLSWKKKYGFLHVIEDIVGVFDELHVSPFLDLLVGCVVRVLESCTSSLDNAKLNGLPSDQSNSRIDVDSLQEDSVPANQILVIFCSCWMQCLYELSEWTWGRN